MKNNSMCLLIIVMIVTVFGGFFAYASQTDERIETATKQSYVFKTYLKDDSIQTTSRDGAVTLKGAVKEQSHKNLAQETVASLPGVINVDNQLVVREESPAENSDGWISMQVKYSLLYNRHVSGMSTKVFVTDGVVTLRGEAENQAQKDLAGEYAKDIKGVREIKNEMTLAKDGDNTKQTMGERIDDASITAQIKMALLSHHSTSAFKTGVTTKDGEVTLTGKVSSEAGKDMVGKVANDVHGVISVLNNIAVDGSLKDN